MPKKDGMAQLSRPFQALLVAFCLLAAVWFFAVHGRSTSTTSPQPSVSSTPAVTTAPRAASTPSSSAATAEAEAKAAGAPSHVYHGPVPGLEGLTRDIAKAHGAVATSQQRAKQAEAASAESSAGSAPAAATSVPAHPAPAISSPSSSAPTRPAPTTGVAPAVSKTSAKAAPRTTVRVRVHGHTVAPKAASKPALAGRQASVEAQLARGDVVLLLFWNPSGADDTAVRSEVRRLAAAHARAAHTARLAVQEALASEVAAFGAITRGVQIYSTPTLLVIAKGGRASMVSGFTDAFAIQQAIEEVQSA